MRIKSNWTALQMQRNGTQKSSSTKRAANLSVNHELLAKAQRLGINLSRVLEDRLTELVRDREREDWLRQNRAAIDAYNERIERDRVFSDGLRTF
jgi:antitoxin CcdA